MTPGQALYNILTSSPPSANNCFDFIISGEENEDSIRNYKQNTCIVFKNKYYQIELKSVVGIKQSIQIANKLKKLYKRRDDVSCDYVFDKVDNLKVEDEI